ncbi:MAG: ABC transporter permease [Actinomycetota bacterium]
MLVNPDRAMADDLRGLDILEIPRAEAQSLGTRVWAASWPKAAAALLVLAVWQAVVWSGWRPVYVLPGPTIVLGELVGLVQTSEFYQALSITIQRGVGGFVIALSLGATVGLAVSQSRVLRRAIGSAITGIQSMPSIAWFPLAILLFKLSEAAILFVMVLGAAPSVANGLISGVDHIPPILRRAGKVLGARGVELWRHVIIPAALPGVVAGLKQGWAFAWRSLMAGELLVIIASRPSIGVRLQFARELSDAPALLAIMAVVFAIGIVVDLLFGTLDRRLRRHRGLLVATG